jgi:hypothetical protein
MAEGRQTMMSIAGSPGNAAHPAFFAYKLLRTVAKNASASHGAESSFAALVADEFGKVDALTGSFYPRACLQRRQTRCWSTG